MTRVRVAVGDVDEILRTILRVTAGDAARRFRVLVLCTGNSARSQIAEALLAMRGAGRIEAVSAGTRPAERVNPRAVDVLRERGIVWEGRVPKHVDDVAGGRYDLVITVCDDARETCPYLPDAGPQVHWGLPDPAAARPEDARRAFGETYDALARRVEALLALPLERLEPATLRARAAALHAG